MSKEKFSGPPDVSPGLPHVEQVGLITNGDLIHDSLSGLPNAVLGPHGGATVTHINTGPLQPSFPVILHSERGRKSGSVGSTPAGLNGNFGNMEMLRLRDEIEADFDDLEVSGGLASMGKEEGLPCSTIPKQQLDQGTVLPLLSLKQWKQRARTKGPALILTSPVEAPRKRKEGSVSSENQEIMVASLSHLSAEASNCKKVRTLTMESDCEMTDGGVAVADVQPRCSL